MKIHYATISETGKRQNNEDAFRIVNGEDGNRWLAVVCDGMGGCLLYTSYMVDCNMTFNRQQ